MTPSFATSLDALSGWRTTLAQRLDDVAGFLRDHDLADPPAAAHVAALRERLGHEKLVVAFVAEFSRGKSELINAIFFADTAGVFCRPRRGAPRCARSSWPGSLRSRLR